MTKWGSSTVLRLNADSYLKRWMYIGSLMMFDGIWFYPTSCVYFIPKPSQGDTIHTKSWIKIEYHHKSLEILYISHVLPRILLNPNRLCKTDICEPHSTFTIRRQNLTHGKSSLKFSKQTFNFRAYLNQFMQKKK